jgi:hypothetical protein
MIEASGPGGLETLVNPNGKNGKHEEKSEQLGGTCVCAAALVLSEVRIYDAGC